MTDYMTEFNRRKAQRRAARDQAAIADYTARAERAQNERNLYSQRRKFIDTIPGLTNEQRGNLHHRGQARANASSIMASDYADRLREFDDALATGAASINDYRDTVNRQQQAQYVTQYTPKLLDAEVRQGEAKAQADAALAEQRRAEAQTQVAESPSRIRQRDAESLLNELGASGVAEGNLVPPGFDEVAKPAPMNDLDEARAENLRADTARLIDQVTNGPKREQLQQQLDAFSEVLKKDSGASPKDRQYAIDHITSLITNMRDAGDIGDASVRKAQDASGETVYEISPGLWVYKDGKPYSDPEAEFEARINDLNNAVTEQTRVSSNPPSR